MTHRAFPFLAGALLALLWAFGWFLQWAPGYLQRTGEAMLGERTGMPVTIGEVRLELRELAIEAHDLRIGAADASPRLGIERIRADAGIAGLVRKRVLDALTIDAPLLVSTQDADRRFDLVSLAARLARPAEGTPAGGTPAEPGELPGISFGTLSLNAGRVRLIHGPSGAVREIEALQIAIPALSLARQAKQQPVPIEASARIENGSLRIDGRMLPLADVPSLQAELDLDDLGLAGWRPFAPALPGDVRAGAQLSAQLQLELHADTAPAAKVSGDVRLANLQLDPRDGDTLATARALVVEGISVDTVRRSAIVDSARIEAPTVSARRDAQGRIDWLGAFGEPDRVEPDRAPAEPTQLVPAPSGDAASAAAGTRPWSWRLKALQLTEGRVSFRDAAVQPASTLALEAISVEADSIGNGPEDTARFEVRAAGAATIEASGSLQGLRQLALQADLAGLALAALAPYAAPYWSGAIESGQASAGLRLNADLQAPAESLTVEQGQLTLEGLAVRARGASATGSDAPLRADRISATRISASVAERRADIGEIELRAPAARLARSQDGAIDLLALVGQRDPPAQPRESGAVDAPDVPGWEIRIAQARLAQGAVQLLDRSVDPPARVELEGLAASLRDWSSRRPADLSYTLEARLAAGGELAASGQLQAAPLRFQSDVRASSIPLALAQAYAGGRLNLNIVSGTASAQGALSVSMADAEDAWQLSYTGTAAVADFDALDRAEGTQVAGWQQVDAQGIVLDWHSADASKRGLAVDTLRLNDFQARVIIHPDGRLNLLDVIAPETGPAPSLTQTNGTADATLAAAAAHAERPAVNRQSGGAGTAGIGASGEAGVAPGALIGGSTQGDDAASGATTRRAPIGGDGAGGLPLPLRIGRIELAGGEVRFTDNFVQPNFSARLTQLEGTVTTLDSASAEPAEVRVLGRVDDSSPLTVSGSVRPLYGALFLELQGSTRGYELTSLSTYSAKYAGYRISKGKLDAEVSYKVEDGVLEASNRIVLDQLTFGEKVESPQATNLPVQLAIALLKDVNGVIDVELPVSGSLSDPQFSLGAVIGNAIANLIVKIVTAPFRLLASLVGASQTDLSQVEFGPGEAALDDDARGKLRELVGALEKRPQLAVEMQGHADRGADLVARRRELLDERLVALKRRSLAAAGQPAEPQQLRLGEAERAELLVKLFVDEGLHKPDGKTATPIPPPDEIERRLLARVEVPERTLIELAEARARAVRDFLVEQKVDPERLYLVAARIGREAKAAASTASGEAAAGPPAAAGTSAPAQSAQSAPSSDAARIVELGIRPR